MSHPIRAFADGQVEFEEDSGPCPHWFIRYQEVQANSDVLAVVCNSCDLYLRPIMRQDVPVQSGDNDSENVLF